MRYALGLRSSFADIINMIDDVGTRTEMDMSRTDRARARYPLGTSAPTRWAKERQRLHASSGSQMSSVLRQPQQRGRACFLGHTVIVLMALTTDLAQR